MMLEMLLLLLKLSPHWMQVISSVSVTVLPGGEGAVGCVCYHEMQYPVLINNLRILHCLTVFRQVAYIQWGFHVLEIKIGLQSAKFAYQSLAVYLISCPYTYTTK